MDLICNTHGISEHKKKKRATGEERWICKKCEYASSRRYLLNLKLKAIKYGGGECTKCGYDKCWRALHFHHIDPSKKEFNIFERRKGYFKCRSWEGLKKEIDKCLLLCANCHTEIHDSEPKLSIECEKILNIGRTNLYLINKSIISNKKTPLQCLEEILKNPKYEKTCNVNDQEEALGEVYKKFIIKNDLLSLAIRKK